MRTDGVGLDTPTVRPPRVLLVGEGPPARGGIPSFIGLLLADRDLASKYAFRWLNTTRDHRTPGAWSGGNLLRGIRDAARVRTASRAADVVHIHAAPAPTPPLLRTVALVIAARSTGTPVLVHAHSGRMHRSITGGLYRRLLAWLIGHCRSFVVVSQREADALEAIGPVHLVPNGVDTSIWKPRSDPATHPDRASDRMAALFVGTVCARKGLLDLAAALERTSTPIALSIIGDARQEGPDAEAAVREAFRGDVNGHSVRFLGPLDRDAVVSHMQAAELFLLPSHWEGQPLSMLEAMATGLPVIATDVGDVAEMLGNEEAGITVPVRDPAALARAIETMASDAELRSDRGRAARRRVERLYSETRVAEDIDALYVGALTRGTRDLARTLR